MMPSTQSQTDFERLHDDMLLEFDILTPCGKIVVTHAHVMHSAMVKFYSFGDALIYIRTNDHLFIFSKSFDKN